MVSGIGRVTKLRSCKAVVKEGREAGMPLRQPAMPLPHLSAHTSLCPASMGLWLFYCCLDKEFHESNKNSSSVDSDSLRNVADIEGGRGRGRPRYKSEPGRCSSGGHEFAFGRG